MDPAEIFSPRGGRGSGGAEVEPRLGQLIFRCFLGCSCCVIVSGLLRKEGEVELLVMAAAACFWESFSYLRGLSRHVQAFSKPFRKGFKSCLKACFKPFK